MKFNKYIEGIFWFSIALLFVITIAQPYMKSHFTYMISILALSITTVAYYLSTFNLGKITHVMTDTTTCTAKLKEVTHKILEAQESMTNEQVRHIDSFYKLNNKLLSFLNGLEDYKSVTIKIVITNIAMGFLSKEHRALYKQFKKCLLELIKTDASIEIITINPFIHGWADQKNTISSYFINLERDTSTPPWSRCMMEYFVFFQEICKSYDNSNFKANKKIFLVDSIYSESAVIFANEISNSIQFHYSILENSIYANGFFTKNATHREFILNEIIRYRDEYTLTDMFEQYDSLDRYFLLSKMQNCISANHAIDKCFESIDGILNNKRINTKYNKVCRVHNETYDFRLFEFYSKKVTKDEGSYILVLPSGSGIYAQDHFNDYMALCYDLANNSHVLLCSFTGQDNFENAKYPNCLPFSFPQCQNDLKCIFDKYKDRISGVFAICVGAQAYIAYSNNKEHYLPVFVWDLPDKPGWDKPLVFTRKTGILINDTMVVNTCDPIENFLEHKNSHLCYAYNSLHKDNFQKIINCVNQKENWMLKTYKDLKHVPESTQNPTEYNSFLNDVHATFEISSMNK